MIQWFFSGFIIKGGKLLDFFAHGPSAWLADMLKPSVTNITRCGLLHPDIPSFGPIQVYYLFFP
jgi:hypothetical protein